MIEHDKLNGVQDDPALETLTRTSRTELRRRRRFRKRAGIVALALIVVAAGVWAVNRRSGGESGATGNMLGTPLEGAQVTYVVTTQLADDISEQADTIAVFALDARGSNPFILFVPAAVQAEVPGHGFDSVGRALSFGGVPLHMLTVENMLGADIDHQVTIRDKVLARLVDQAGGVDIEVAERLLAPDTAGRRIPVFEPGRQHMNGGKVSAYLAYLGPDETELSRPARARQIWDGLFAKWKEMTSTKLARQFTALGAEFSTDAPVGDAGRFFAAMAATPPGMRVYSILPTTPVGAGGEEEALRLDEDGVQGLMRQFLGDSLRVKQGDPVRVEILNGNGVPQIGEKVSRVLIPAGFRLVLDRNADRFNYPKTRIVVYERDDSALAIARRVKELLKVGEIEIALQSQTLVDVTIVVGKDFVSR
jgi:anionic cell wall polymer biosynthesis LytR-Cps2A-Psr (LCP) family protein